MGASKGTVKLSAKETKWTLLEVRTRPTFLETLISKYDKLLGLSRNGPQELEAEIKANRRELCSR